jgi:hypothetical protein
MREGGLLIKTVLRVVVVALFLLGCAQGTFSQTADRESFDKKLYSLFPLSRFGTGPKQFGSLSAKERESLLACREVLRAFFTALDEGREISPYLTPELARKYGKGLTLIDPESTIMEVGIFDWNIGDPGKKIDLRFLAVVSSEGDWILSKNVATLERSGDHWRVVAFRWKEK